MPSHNYTSDNPLSVYPDREFDENGIPYFRLFWDICRRSDISQGAKILHAVLDTLCRNGGSTLADEQIAPLIGVGVRQTHQLINELARKNLIVIYGLRSARRIYMAEDAPLQEQVFSQRHVHGLFCPGYVYLLGSEHGCKIGRSGNARKRFREISSAVPFDTDLLHVIKSQDCQTLEKWWHRRFAEKRFFGEWFHLDAANIAEFCAYVEVSK